LSDFSYSDDDGDAINKVRISSIQGLGTIYLNGTAVANNQEIDASEISAGHLTFKPADYDNSGSDQYVGDTRPDGSTVQDGDLGDQGEDYARFDFQVSDGANWSNTATMDIDINAVADTPSLSLSATSITTTETIDENNVTDTSSGFTVTAYKADGTQGNISIHNSNPTGFGVAGDVDGTPNTQDPGRGDPDEIQYDTTLDNPETIVVKFDTPVESIDLSLAWNDPHENVAVSFYKNGNLLDTAYTGAGTDGVDGPYHLTPQSIEATFDEIRLYPPSENDDFLIHSITYNKTEVRSDGTVVMEEAASADLAINAGLNDTDGSESLKVELQNIPDGFTISDGTHSFTSDGTTTTVDITDWDRANLTLTAPEVDSDATYTLKAVATATEYSNSDSASVTQDINVTVKAITTAVSPTISGEQESHVSEEGLTNGIPDSNGTDDQTDTTTHSGQFIVHDVNGDCLTVTLSAPTGSYSSGGDTIDWSVSGDGKTLTGITHNGGETVLTVTIDNDGNYTTTLDKPFDHPDTTTEDTLTIPISVTVSDGDSETSDVTSTLNVVVEDDSPIAQDSETTVLASTAPVTTNVIVIYDRSGSMNENPQGTEVYADRHNLAIDAISSMIESYNALGSVNAAVVDFSTNGTWHNWMSGNNTADKVASLLTSLPVFGATDYQEAVKAAINGYKNSTIPTADRTVIYFVSDGDPNHGDLHNNIDDWKDFVTDTTQAEVYAVGIGSKVSLDGTTDGNDLGSLNMIALKTDNDSTNDQTKVILSDEKGLSEYLHNTISVTNTTSGNVSTGSGGTAISYGGDGAGHIQSISIGGTTHTYDGVHDTVTFDTPLGGSMTFNFLTGDYTYTANVTLDNAGESEVFDLVTQDADGDTDDSTLTVNLSLVTNPTVASDTIITNAISNDGDTLAVSKEALMANDVDLDGDSFVFSSAQNPSNGTINVTASVEFTVNTIPASDFGTDYTTVSGNGRNIDISDRSQYGAVNDGNAGNVVDPHLTSLLVDDAYVYNNDYDKYTLELKAGEVLYLDMDNVNYDPNGDGNEATIMMNLRDSDGNLLKGSYYGEMFTYDPASAYGGGASESDGIHDPYMEYRVTQDGTYTLYVYDEDGDGNGPDDSFDDEFSYDLWATIDDRYVKDGAFDYTIEDSTDANKNDDGAVKIDVVDGTELVGRASDDILIGTAGQDDQLYGKSGDDTLVYDSGDSVIDGGENLTGNYDNDTLLLINDDDIDFSALDNDIVKNIETIDLKDGAHDLSNLSLQDVIDMTDSDNDLLIKGDSDDSVALTGGVWQQGTTTSDGYVEYTNSNDPTVVLKIDEDLSNVTIS
jgi:T1SS-143 domain-containing protein